MSEPIRSLPDPGKGLPRAQARAARQAAWRLVTPAQKQAYREMVRYQFETVNGGKL